jgi:spoIIIJ-associated protein
MRFTEVEGKSKQDAMEKAARELNVPVEEIGIEVLSDSSRGFFSLIGGRKVKVRAWSKRESREKLLEEVEQIREEVGPLRIPPVQPDGNHRYASPQAPHAKAPRSEGNEHPLNPQTREGRASRPGGRERSGGPQARESRGARPGGRERSGGPQVRESRTARPDGRERSGSPQSRESRGSRAEGRDRPGSPQSRDSRASRGDGRERSGGPQARDSRGARPGRRERPASPQARDSRASRPDSAERPAEASAIRSDAADHPVSPQAEQAQKLLKDMLAWLSDQATVDVLEDTKERIRLEILGDKTGLLIGKRGQTLDALQFLLNKMINRNPESSKRIEVDMEEYRKRREQSLRNMATRLGEKVKKKKKPITVEAMSAHDRRIIHLTLKSDQSLETRSVGKGEMRKLVIHLANNGRSKGDEGSEVSS